MEEKRVQREGNFEAIRLVSMLFIILLHAWKRFEAYQFPVTDGNRAFLLQVSWVNSFCVVAVNLFFMLSGYFRIKYSTRKLIQLVIDVYLYHTISVVLSVLLEQGSITEHLLELAVPFMNYWYVIVYLLLMLLSPWLNRLIDTMERKDFQAVAWFYLVVGCIISWLSVFMFGVQFDRIIGFNKGLSLISAIFLYIIGAGISKTKKDAKIWWGGVEGKSYLLCSCVNGLLCTFFLLYLPKQELYDNVLIYNNFFVVIASIGLFRWMSRRTYKETFSRVFLTLGKGTFAVYLVHDAIMQWIPVELLTKGQGLLWLFGLLAYAVLILVICLFIDILKQKFLGNILRKFSAWLGTGIDNIANKVIFRT